MIRMIGSEYLVLQASALRTSLRLRIYVNGKVEWEGFGPPVVTEPAIEDGGPSVRSVELIQVLGPQLFRECELELGRRDSSFLVIQVSDDELALAAWGHLAPEAVVVDYSGRPSTRALEPLDLPIGVLQADLNQRFEFDDDRAHPMHHFATTALGFVGIDRLEHTLRRLPHDVVHLRTRVVERSGEVWLSTREAGLQAEQFGRLVRRPRHATRLVILEVEPSDTAAAFLLARKLRGATGPSVLVIDGSFNVRAFYYAITHSESLRWATRESRSVPAGERLPRLFIADGGDETLSLERAADRFSARVATEKLRFGEVRERLGRIGEDLTLAGLASPEVLGDLAFSYDHESDGLEPIGDASIDLERSSAAIRDAERRLARVVNTWFSAGDGTPIPNSESLVASTDYGVDVSVGSPEPQSNIAVPFRIDEDALDEHYEPGGTRVRVVFISDDVAVRGESELVLVVPRPPSSSDLVRFLITTPGEAGRITARIALYAGNNLLQSIALEADVTIESAVKRQSANVGRVDWVLTGKIGETDRLDEKAFSVLTNERPDGTHLIAVEGTTFRGHVTLGETQVTALLDKARKTLQWAAGDPDSSPYNYAPDNNGDTHQLWAYLTGSAELGWDMYNSLITQHDDRKFDSDLSDALATPTTLQFARTSSSRLSYPWALVYDHPHVHSEQNVLCGDFLSAMNAGEPLEKSQCFTTICRNKNDPNIVCPSGFWGFRHIIEQPLGSFNASDEDVITGQSEIPDVINTGGHVNAFVGYSSDLDPDHTHVDEVLAIREIDGYFATARTDVVRGLQQSSLELIYFFCHGGSRSGKAWLGVGDKPPEKIVAPDLLAYGIEWPGTRPLVFINGCETAAARPDDLATFNENLRYCKASGVIGTEIKVPVDLGREVGVDLIRKVVDERIAVGRAMREVRLGLLARCNPLGLAYTPYCLARLRMI